jgi:hypothetical protein
MLPVCVVLAGSGQRFEGQCLCWGLMTNACEKIGSASDLEGTGSPRVFWEANVRVSESLWCCGGVLASLYSLDSSCAGLPTYCTTQQSSISSRRKSGLMLRRIDVRYAALLHDPAAPMLLCSQEPGRRRSQKQVAAARPAHPHRHRVRPASTFPPLRPEPYPSEAEPPPGVARGIESHLIHRHDHKVSIGQAGQWQVSKAVAELPEWLHATACRSTAATPDIAPRHGNNANTSCDLRPYTSLVPHSQSGAPANCAPETSRLDWEGTASR